MSIKPEPIVIDALNGRTAIEVCLEILRGRYSGIFEYGSSAYGHNIYDIFKNEKKDDREIQMSACYYLAENAKIGDWNVINVLKSKLDDERSEGNYSWDDEKPEDYGSHFCVNRCAADALAALTDGEADLDLVPLNKVLNEDNYFFWAPRKLEVKNGIMYLLSDKLCGGSTGTLPSYYLRTIRFSYFCGCGATPEHYTLYCENCGDELYCAAIPCIPTLRCTHSGE